MNEKKEQLQDGCLIVENAGMMTETTAENLLWFIHHTNVLGTVILEDNATAISNLLRNQAECNREFNNRVHLPKYDSGGKEIVYSAEEVYISPEWKAEYGGITLDGNRYEITVTNVYRMHYELPETGGGGNIISITGGIVLLRFAVSRAGRM